jgi:hypothetical protein
MAVNRRHLLALMGSAAVAAMVPRPISADGVLIVTGFDAHGQPLHEIIRVRGGPYASFRIVKEATTINYSPGELDEIDAAWARLTRDYPTTEHGLLEPMPREKL